MKRKRQMTRHGKQRAQQRNWTQEDAHFVQRYGKAMYDGNIVRYEFTGQEIIFRTSKGINQLHQRRDLVILTGSNKRIVTGYRRQY